MLKSLVILVVVGLAATAFGEVINFETGAEIVVKKQVINFDTGAEIIVKKQVINFDTGVEIKVKAKKEVKQPVQQKNYGLKVSDIIIVKKVSENIWVSYNKKTDKYTMRYIPMKEYKEKQIIVKKYTKHIENAIKSLLAFNNNIKTVSVKYP